jgi:glycosyltransferase involved in cell wall biosynthesis
VNQRQLSVVVTTLNNAATLDACLASVQGLADEIVVLDSFSSDATAAIAHAAGARFLQQKFQGYGPQKQSAVNAARHDWILLLDADEALSAAAPAAIRAALDSEDAPAAYTLARIEQMFWAWPSAGTRHNHFLRLFDRRQCALDDDPIHAAPKAKGRVIAIQAGDAAIVHFGEPNLQAKVAKLNHYAEGLSERYANKSWLRTRMLLNPLWVLCKQLVLKRQLLNGWAGIINALCLSFYAFLKYAKAYERRQSKTPPPPLAGASRDRQ